MITRRKPIRRVSSKRAAQLKEYSKLRKEFLAANPFCQVWMDENPEYAAVSPLSNMGISYWEDNRATDVHHMKKRVGKMLLDTRYWMAVSRTAHQRIHQFPKWAREKGYLLDK